MSFPHSMATTLKNHDSFLQDDLYVAKGVACSYWKYDGEHE